MNDTSPIYIPKSDSELELIAEKIGNSLAANTGIRVTSKEDLMSIAVDALNLSSLYSFYNETYRITPTSDGSPMHSTEMSKGTLGFYDTLLPNYVWVLTNSRLNFIKVFYSEIDIEKVKTSNEPNLEVLKNNTQAFTNSHNENPFWQYIKCRFQIESLSIALPINESGGLPLCSNYIGLNHFLAERLSLTSINPNLPIKELEMNDIESEYILIKLEKKGAKYD